MAARLAVVDNMCCPPSKSGLDAYIGWDSTPTHSHMCIACCCETLFCKNKTVSIVTESHRPEWQEEDSFSLLGLVDS